MHLHQCRNRPCPGAEWPRAGTRCGFPISVIRKEKHSLHLNTAWHGRILPNEISYQQCVQRIDECEGETEGNKQTGHNERIWLLNPTVCFNMRNNVLQTKKQKVHSKKQEWIMPLKIQLYQLSQWYCGPKTSLNVKEVKWKFYTVKVWSREADCCKDVLGFQHLEHNLFPSWCTGTEQVTKKRWWPLFRCDVWLPEEDREEKIAWTVFVL